MARLGPVDQSDLDDAQRALIKAITTGKRTRGRSRDDFFLADGSLRGPFNAWLYAPNVGHPAQRLGEAIRYETRLPPKLRELAILLVAAHWRADYEWWAHSRLARDAGLDDDVIAAIKDGALPESADETQRAVHDFARELQMSRRVSAETYERAVSLLGEATVVELVTLIGYYALVSMVLNVFEVDMPAGAQPPFDTRA